jgi:hypothetical protein
MPLPAELGRVVAGVARAFQLKRRVLDIEPVSQCSFDPFLHGVCVGPTPLGYDDRGATMKRRSNGWPSCATHGNWASVSMISPI